MTARDEDILTSPSLLRKGIAIERVIQNVIVDKTINVGEMIRGDRDAIMISLRITGYGSEYKANVTCPRCDDSFDYEFDLSALPLKRLEIEPAQPNTNQFEFELPLSKKKITWNFLTTEGEKDLSQIQKKKKGGNENLVTIKLINSILAIDGDTNRSNIAAFVRNMPARDSLALRMHIDGAEPRIEMKDEISCSQCGEETEVVVPMNISFFWPHTDA